MTHVGLFAASPFGLIGSLVSFGWLGILFVYCLLLVFEVCACALVCVCLKGGNGRGLFLLFYCCCFFICSVVSVGCFFFLFF